MKIIHNYFPDYLRKQNKCMRIYKKLSLINFTSICLIQKSSFVANLGLSKVEEGLEFPEVKVCLMKIAYLSPHPIPIPSWSQKIQLLLSPVASQTDSSNSSSSSSSSSYFDSSTISSSLSSSFLTVFLGFLWMLNTQHSPFPQKLNPDYKGSDRYAPKKFPLNSSTIKITGEMSSLFL